MSPGGVADHWGREGRGPAADASAAGWRLAWGSSLMNQARLPPPGMHGKVRACPPSQDDSGRGYLHWIFLKGMMDASSSSFSVSQIPRMLVYHLNDRPFRKPPPHCKALLHCFSLLKGLSLFTFFVLHSCTAWYLHQCLISPVTLPSRQRLEHWPAGTASGSIYSAPALHQALC